LYSVCTYVDGGISTETCGTQTSRINLFLSGTEDSVMMIEGAADFVSEEEMMGAIDAGMEV